MTTLPLLDHPIVLAAAIEARDEIAYHALPDAEIDWSALRDWFARRLCDLSLTASRDWWVRHLDLSLFDDCALRDNPTALAAAVMAALETM